MCQNLITDVWKLSYRNWCRSEQGTRSTCFFQPKKFISLYKLLLFFLSFFLESSAKEGNLQRTTIFILPFRFLGLYCHRCGLLFSEPTWGKNLFAESLAQVAWLSPLRLAWNNANCSTYYTCTSYNTQALSWTNDIKRMISILSSIQARGHSLTLISSAPSRRLPLTSWTRFYRCVKHL